MNLKKMIMFLKSWLTVVASQTRKDKRTRKKYNMFNMIFDIVNVLEPILNRKHVVVNVDSNDKFVERKVI